MLYRILLSSAKYQYESAIGIHMFPPSWRSLPSASPFHPSRLLQSPYLSSLNHTANFHWLSILHMVCKFPCYSLHTSYSLLPPPILLIFFFFFFLVQGITLIQDTGDDSIKVCLNSTIRSRERSTRGEIAGKNPKPRSVGGIA